MKVRVCKKGYQYVQVCSSDGEVRLCPHIPEDQDKILGSLLDHSMEELLTGEKARAFRQSMYDGSYCFCRKNVGACPYLSNGILEANMIEVDTENELTVPKWISLSYERGCNYRCTVCVACQSPTPGDEERKKIEIIEQRLKPILNQVEIINANGLGELFVSRSALKLLSEWKPELPADQVMVDLETNGSLFTEKNWAKISNLGQYTLKVSITVMSFEEKTYQFLSGTKQPISQLLKNLQFVKKLREEGVINRLELATVVQESNFRTLPSFVKHCLKFSPDAIRLRDVFALGAQPRDVEWFADVRNPHHPSFREYMEIRKDPILKNPKVFLWSGDEVSGLGTYADFVLEGRVLQPGQQVLQPGQKILEPGQQVLQPGQKILEPGQQVLQPGEVAMPAASAHTLEEAVGSIAQSTKIYESHLSGVLESLAGNISADTTDGGVSPAIRDRLWTSLRQMTDISYIDEGIRNMRGKYPHIVIMGSGFYGQKMARQFQNCGLDFDGFVVSDGRCHPDMVMGKPVWNLSDLPFRKEELGVIVAMNHIHWNEVSSVVKCKGLNYLNPFAVVTDIQD